MLSLSSWGVLIGIFALEVTTIVGLVAIACKLTQNAKLQRAFWQAAIIGLILLGLSEVLGLRNSFFRVADDVPRRHLNITLATIDASEVPPAGRTGGAKPLDPISASSVRWPGWLWGGGTLMLLALNGISWTRLTLAKRRMPVSESEVVTNQLLSRVGSARVSIRIWPRVKGPVAFGFWRPTIAIPPDFAERFSREQREVMLAHESAHLVLRDPVWFGLMDLVCAFVWWHPLLWRARRSFRRACESAADEASALFPAGPTTLAESLVALGRELSLGGAGKGLGVGGSGSTSELGFRVHALLRTNVQWHRLSAWWLWTPRGLAVCLVGFLILLPLQSIFPCSILEALTSCVHPAIQPNPTPAGNSPQTESPAKQTQATAQNVKKTNSVVVMVEFAEVPDSKSSPLELLFQGIDLQESTITTRHADDLFPVAKPPSQKNVIADRSTTEGQVVLLNLVKFVGIRRDLRSQSGVDWLSTSDNGIKVSSGGEVVAKVNEARTIVFGAETKAGTLTNPATVNYKTGEIATGPEARIRLRATNGGWHLNIALRCLEFLGYDDPGRFVPETRGSGDAWGPAPEALEPLPHFRLRESQAAVVAGEGQTVVVRGPLKADITKTKSGLFQRESEVKKTSRLYIFLSLLPAGDKRALDAQTRALTSRQATDLAQTLANDKAETLYNCRPFSNSPSAQLVDGFWVWREVRGQGQVDLEAEVKFAPDGGNPSVSVVLLDSRGIIQARSGRSP